MIVSGQFVEGQSTSYGNSPCGWPHGASNESWRAGIQGSDFVRDGAGNLCRLVADVSGMVGQIIFTQYQRGRAKCISLDDVGACFQIIPMDFSDDIRAGDIEVLVTTFVTLSAEIFRAQASCLNLCSHRSIHDKNSSVKERFQFIDTF